MMVTVGEKAVCKVKLWLRDAAATPAPGGDQAILKLAAVLEEVFGAGGGAGLWKPRDTGDHGADSGKP